MFQFAESLHFTVAIILSPIHFQVAQQLVHVQHACHALVTPQTIRQKLEWWNSSDGIERRNQEGAHIPISYPSKVYKYCLICHSHTKYHCSKCALKDPECTFPACISFLQQSRRKQMPQDMHGNTSLQWQQRSKG